MWFIYTREVLRDYFAPFGNLVAWYERMRKFGHGKVEFISGAAKSAEPEEIADVAFLDDFEASQMVSVMPIDYGFQPVTGELLVSSMDEISIARTDDQVGRIVVHFPRIGFRVMQSVEG